MSLLPLLCLLLVCADEPPTPEPVAAVQIHLPEGVSDVPRDALLIITSDEPLLILQVPDAGVLRLKKIKSPLSIASMFADGDGTLEFREYNQAHVWVATAGVAGATELLLIPVGVESEDQILRRMLTVGGPRPPPEPDPIDPDDPPKPPGPVKSFRVIFVKESGVTLPSSQSSIPAARAIRDYLTARTTPEGGLAGWREYDPDYLATFEQPAMKSLWAAVQSKVTNIPCMVIEVNGQATVMPFPANVDEALKTLKKHGGG